MFRAAIYTQEGRPGTDGLEIMGGFVEQATSGGAMGHATTVRQRFAHEATVQIMARLANMIHA
eukprot:9072983-Lingulodinium_polyedra.AAC.1